MLFDVAGRLGMKAGNGIQVLQVNCYPIGVIRLLNHDAREAVPGEGTVKNILLNVGLYFLFKESFNENFHGIDLTL